MPKIIIKRTSEFESKARKFKIEINGTIGESIKDGEEKTFEVEAGNYSIRAKIDWCTSNTVNLSLENDATVKLILGSGKGHVLYRAAIGWNSFLNLSVDDL